MSNLPREEDIESMLAWTLNEGYSKATELISNYCKTRGLIVSIERNSGISRLIFQPAGQRKAYAKPEGGAK